MFVEYNICSPQRSSLRSCSVHSGLFQCRVVLSSVAWDPSPYELVEDISGGGLEEWRVGYWRRLGLEEDIGGGWDSLGGGWGVVGIGRHTMDCVCLYMFCRRRASCSHWWTVED